MWRVCMIVVVGAAGGCSGDSGKSFDLGSDQLVADQRMTDGKTLDVAVKAEAGRDKSKPDVRPDSGPPSAWKETNFSATFNAVWGLNATTIFAVGKGGLIVRYDGTSWKTMTNPEKFELNAVWGSSASNVYAAGESGVIKWDGTAWAKDGSSYDVYAYRSLYGTSDNLFAAGPGGRLGYKALTGTYAYWSSVYFSSTIKNDFNGVWGTGSDIFVVGNDGLILKCSTSSCTTSSNWTTMTSGTTSHLRAVWGSSATDVFVVGLDGTILHYDGTTWSPLDAKTSTYFYGVWGAGANDVYVVGNPIFKADEAIFHYDGSTWTTLPPPKTTIGYFGIWASGAKDVWAVGNAGSILHYDGTKP
jgi:hypothetical protein